MPLSHRQLREAFHFLFLKRLLRISDPRLYVLKGGVNLRFYFASPRYSEDMDLDVLGGSVSTLRKTGYRILDDARFRRSLESLGIADLRVNDPAKAKHTETTQRFRLRLVTGNQDELPTKVEFSRRGTEEPYALETIDPNIARPFNNLAFPCQHYTTVAALHQKALALANRSEVQARDVFDLYVLWLGGHAEERSMASLDASDLERAADNLLTLEYADYEGQVLEFLEPGNREEFSGELRWQEITERVLSILTDASHG